MTSGRNTQPSVPRDPAVIRRAQAWRRWLLEGELTREGLLTFRAWLLHAREHRDAYRYIESIDRGPGPQRALMHIERANELYAPLRRPRARSPWRWLLLGLFLLVVVVAVGLVASDQGLRTLPQRVFAEHSAGIGERGRVELPDGTVIQLGSRTAFNLEAAAESFDLDLIEGEIYVEQPPDATARLEIASPHGGASALGARFGYRDVREQAVVSVVEGRVVALLLGGSSDARALESGEEAAIAAAGLGATRALALQDSLAWRRRLLLQEGWTLGSLAEELRRYHAGVILIVDPQAAESGIAFSRRQSTQDPAAVLQEAAGQLGIGYRAYLDGFVLLLGDFPWEKAEASN
ncbi:MAG: FecR domain-containing protein [Rhodovibrionaceae bacterium]